MNKKLIILILSTLILLCFTACGGNENSTGTREKDVQENEMIEQDESKAQRSGTESMVTPEFKRMMDSYEDFFDKYIEFMKKYRNSDDIVSMMSEFEDYMKKYADVMQKMNEINEDDLSTADLAYYTEVSARIMKKLGEVL